MTKSENPVRLLCKAFTDDMKFTSSVNAVVPIHVVNGNDILLWYIKPVGYNKCKASD